MRGPSRRLTVSVSDELILQIETQQLHSRFRLAAAYSILSSVLGCKELTPAPGVDEQITG